MNTWSLYREIREQLLGQLESLSVEQTEMKVPLCPQWRVVDVVSHLCGLNADLVGGMRVGLGAEENTARQVADRSGDTLAQVAAEWRGYDDRIEELYAEITGIGAALVADLVMHVHDVQHALGLEIDREGPGVAEAAARYVDVLKTRVAERLGVEIEINLIDGEPATDGSAAAVSSSPSALASAPAFSAFSAAAATDLGTGSSHA